MTPQITTIRAFFLQIRTLFLFSNFCKRARETPPPLPSIYAPEGIVGRYTSLYFADIDS